MKVLFLTSRIPYPPYRGDKLKIYNLIRQLAPHHEVHLLTFVQRASEERWTADLRQFCASVRTVRMPLVRSLLNCVRVLPTAVPFQVAYFDSAAMRSALAAALADIRPDVVHTHLIRMAPYTAELRGPARVLDLTDAVSLYLRRFMEAEHSALRRMALHSELQRMLTFEPVIRKFDRVLVCSATDRDALLGNVPGAPVSIMENGIDLERFSLPASPERKDPGRIIFTGNMSYYPNVDAAHYFAREIFPLVKEAVPQAKLYIVGQNPPRSVRALVSDDVTVTGFVEDIRSEYLKSVVAVSPIRYGAGTLNKILEPLALGIPVVATSQGIVAATGTDDGLLTIANDPAQFAAEVIRVLRSDLPVGDGIPPLTRYVRDRFGWEAIGVTLRNVYQDIAGSR